MVSVLIPITLQCIVNIYKCYDACYHLFPIGSTHLLYLKKDLYLHPLNADKKHALTMQLSYVLEFWHCSREYVDGTDL